MKRPSMREVALIAVAAGMIAFELMGLNLAGPAAARALAVAPLARGATHAFTVHGFTTHADRVPLLTMTRLVRREARRTCIVTVRGIASGSPCAGPLRMPAERSQSLMSALREAVL